MTMTNQSIKTQSDEYADQVQVIAEALGCPEADFAELLAALKKALTDRDDYADQVQQIAEVVGLPEGDFSQVKDLLEARLLAAV